MSDVMSLDPTFLEECIAEARSGERVTIQTRAPKSSVVRMLVQLGATEQDMNRIEVVRL